MGDKELPPLERANRLVREADRTRKTRKTAGQQEGRSEGDKGDKVAALMKAVALYEEAAALAHGVGAVATAPRLVSPSAGDKHAGTDKETVTGASVECAARYGAGVCLRKLGRLHDAVAAFEAAIALEAMGFNAGSRPGSRPGSMLENLAATHVRLKQHHEAQAAFKAAMALEPGNRKLEEGLHKAVVGFASKKTKSTPF